MIDLNKFHKITVSIDPYTYLAIDNIAKIKGMSLEDYTAHILVYNPSVYDVAESLFKAWVEIEKTLCTNDDE